MSQKPFLRNIIFSSATLEYGLSLNEIAQWQAQGFTHSEIVAAFLSQQEVFAKTRWQRKRTPTTEGQSVKEYLDTRTRENLEVIHKISDLMHALPLKALERFGVEQLLKRSSGLLSKDSVEFVEAQQKKRQDHLNKILFDIQKCLETGNLKQLQESLNAAIITNNGSSSSHKKCWTFNMTARGLNLPLNIWIAEHSKRPGVTAILWGFFLDNMDTDNRVPFTQSMITKLIGFSKEYISCAARDLEAVGAIRIERIKGRPVYYVNDKIVKFDCKDRVKDKVTPEEAGLHFDNVRKERKEKKTRKSLSPQEVTNPKADKQLLPLFVTAREEIILPPPPTGGRKTAVSTRL
ncbi:MAG: hypothetical protein J6V89_04660 [Acetobacter sp.]|nr:hypothetical protein [Acetobacter sp.]